MSNPSISVVIPLYNREDYVIYAIESVHRQTYQPLEIIVVDDNSTDNGPSLVQEYAVKNNLNITLIKNTHSKGVSGSRNTGIVHSKGEYIAFLDSDDVWLAEHLQRVSDCIIKTDAKLISTDFSFFGMQDICDRNIIFFNRLKKKMLKNGFTLCDGKHYLSDVRLFKAALTGGFSLRIQASAIHRDVFYSYNVWFDEKLSFLEDHQFYLECSYKRITMAYVNEIGAMIRKFRDDTHYDKIESHKYRMEKMIKTFDCCAMSLEEEDLFYRAIHEMGFILVKGELLKEDYVTGEVRRRNLGQRIIESLKFLYRFPTNRGLREAVKNIIGDMPSRFLVCLLKGSPYQSVDFQQHQMRDA